MASSSTADGTVAHFQNALRRAVSPTYPDTCHRHQPQEPGDGLGGPVSKVSREWTIDLHPGYNTNIESTKPMNLEWDLDSLY